MKVVKEQKKIVYVCVCCLCVVSLLQSWSSFEGDEVRLFSLFQLCEVRNVDVTQGFQTQILEHGAKDTLTNYHLQVTQKICHFLQIIVAKND